MATGTIRWFSDARGYGFIEPDDKSLVQPLFVHHTGIMGRGYRSLEAGQSVRFELKTKGDHIQAVEVEAL